jgi:hypothetical protein
MKIATFPSPALCQLPLLEAVRPAVKAGVVRSESLLAGFLVRLVTKVWEAILCRVPVGYEDETGFHHGVAEVALPVIRTRRIRGRARLARRRDGKRCGQPI